MAGTIEEAWRSSGETPGGRMSLPTHLQLQIVSADRMLVNEQVDEVEIPGEEGYFGVLPGIRLCLRPSTLGNYGTGKDEKCTTSALPLGSLKFSPTA